MSAITKTVVYEGERKHMIVFFNVNIIKVMIRLKNKRTGINIDKITSVN